jgi:hypothetical protein
MDGREVMNLVAESLPTDHIVTMAATLSADVAGTTGDGEDRISTLPDALRRIIVSFLPIKYAVRTSALSLHWRHFWRSVKLVLSDAHLPKSPHFSAPYAAINSVLNGHPGPFHTVRLSCWPMMFYPDMQQSEWPRLLAEKSIENLIFVNRPRRPRLVAADSSLLLPLDILRCNTVSCLHLGFWTLPDVTKLPHVIMFPNLLELGLHHTIFDTEYIVERSPKLEVLAIVANTNGRAIIRVRNLSTVRVVFWASMAKELDVRGAPPSIG